MFDLATGFDTCTAAIARMTQKAVCAAANLRHEDGMTQTNPPLFAFLIAFGTGGLLTLMVLFNGQLAAHGTAMFASWTAHGTGTIAALVFLLILQRRKRSPIIGQAPAWSFLGGASGALTVVLTSVTVNTALALSGTLALGLVGQVGFGLVADRFGLFGLPRRRPTLHDLAALTLICGGSLLIIFSGGSA